MVGLGRTALAAPPTQAAGVLRVRSTPHFSALRVSPDGAGHRIEGLLHDEQNAPVIAARVELPKGQRFRPCNSGNVVTDEQGHFCLWVGSGPDVAQVAFAGNAHFDPVSLRLSLAQAAPPPTLTVEVPREWIVGQQDNMVRVLVDNPPAGSESQLRLRLVDSEGHERGSQTARLEGRATLFGVGATALPSAGPLGLEVTLVSGAASELARAHASVDVVAVVDLAVDGLPETIRSGQSFTLLVSTRGDSVPVSSGWVEVRNNNQPLAIEPVSQGTARFTLELPGSREYTASLAIQYVSDKPWFHSAPALVRTLSVLGPLPWIHLPWAILAVGAGLWVLRTWRRPLRAVLATLAGVSNGGVRSQLKQTSGPASEWSGVVRDAHTKQPLGGVAIRLSAPGLQQVTLLRETVTDAVGRFRLDKLTSLPEGARLSFTLKTHSTLNQLAPGPCAMEVDLVDRRRSLLTAFHEWVARSSLTQALEPTPQDVADSAGRAADPASATWAKQIDHAVYGPEAPDDILEERLLRERPTPSQTAAKGR